MSEIEKILKELSVKTQLSYQEIKDKFEEFLKQYPVGKAIRKTRAYFAQYIPKGNMLWTKAVILGWEKERNVYKSIRDSISFKFQTASPIERELMISKGIVDSNGVVLDWRKTVFGKPNPNYGKPMTADLWERRYYAFVSTDDFRSATFSVIIATGDKAVEPVNVDYLKPYKVLLARRKISKFTDYVVWDMRKSSEFIPLEDNVSIKDFTAQITCLDSVTLKTSNVKQGWINFTVDDIQTSRNNNVAILYGTAGLNDEESLTEITVYMPTYLPLKFSTQDTIYSYGRFKVDNRGRKCQYMSAYIPIDDYNI